MRASEASSYTRVQTPSGMAGEILSASYTHALVKMDKGGFQRFKLTTLSKESNDVR